MKIKASNRDYWENIASGNFPLEAIEAMHKHLKNPGDRVWVDFVTYELVA